jgi:hypothetical protein
MSGSIEPRTRVKMKIGYVKDVQSFAAGLPDRGIGWLRLWEPVFQVEIDGRWCWADATEEFET